VLWVLQQKAQPLQHLAQLEGLGLGRRSRGQSPVQQCRGENADRPYRGDQDGEAGEEPAGHRSVERIDNFKSNIQPPEGFLQLLPGHQPGQHPAPRDPPELVNGLENKDQQIQLPERQPLDPFALGKATKRKLTRIHNLAAVQRKSSLLPSV
jgi:hypothetical protein